MRPIAQTFYVNEPVDGVPGIYVTEVDIFFKSKSETFPVKLQIRSTDNGVPTSYLMPFAEKILRADVVNVSDDASAATTFRFGTPVFLQSQQSYAIVVQPTVDNDEYQVWTSELNSGDDVTTKTPITKNNDTGTLFLSSNDRQFTTVQTEDLKFILRTAKFKYTTGTAKYVSVLEDKFYIKDIEGGGFFPSEKMVMTNNTVETARLDIHGNTLPFTSNELVYQSNGTANVAIGKIYLHASGVLKLANVEGEWVTDYDVKGATSTVNAIIDTVHQSYQTTLNSNTITVPYTEIFDDLYVNRIMYFRQASGQSTHVTRVSDVVNDTTIRVLTEVPFTESYARIGQIRGNGALYGYYNGPTEDAIINPNKVTIIVNRVTANQTLNFANSTSQLLIGLTTKASANVIGLVDAPYNSLSAQFSVSAPPVTNLSFSFTGTKNDLSLSEDASPISIQPNATTELFDSERINLSRSNSLLLKGGDPSLAITASFSTTNTMVSPILDSQRSTVTFTSNMICSQDDLVGFELLTSNVHGTFAVGDLVTQGNSTVTYGTGTIIRIDDDVLTVANIRNMTSNTYDGYFATHNSTDDASFYKYGDASTNAYITTAKRYGERLNNNYKYASRYISKNVILAEGQDAEDLRLYLTAYRPAGTNFKVYARFKHREDPRTFSSLNWSMMGEITADALLSSTANQKDYVELQFGLPRSYEIFNNSCNCSSSNTKMSLFSTDSVKVGDYIYIKDNTPGSYNFNVRKILGVVDSNVVDIGQKPSFTSDNVAIGMIPGQDGINGTASAFIYTENNNILRYVSRNDKVYDGYKMFAIKLVPISTNSAIVPRAQDMRAIALQI